MPALSAFAQNEPRPPEEILSDSGAIPSADMIRELFINCSSWDEAHEPYTDSSKQALIDMGALAVPILLENLGTTNVLKRVTLDEIIKAIGHDSAQFLIPYLQSENPDTRRHAANLIGETAAIKSSEDLSEKGPHPDDQLALDALVSALIIETDWHVSSSLIGALGYMRDSSEIDLIAGYITDDEQALRLSAVVALGRIPDQEAVPHLIAAFSDPVMTVRQAAVLSLSTKTMGNLGFESLIGTVKLSPFGTASRICALESLYRYLQAVASDDSNIADMQRKRVFDMVFDLWSTSEELISWQTKGFSCMVLAYTYDERAQGFLDQIETLVRHPFILGKIREARTILQTGRPSQRGTSK